LAELFRKHAEKKRLVVCKTATFKAVFERMKLADEIDALKNGRITDVRGRFPVQVGTVSIPNPLAESDTLVDLTARIGDLLPLATAGALSDADRASFVRLLAWQRDILGEIALREAKLAKVDASLSQTANLTWPKDFEGGAQNDFYDPVKDAAADRNIATSQLDIIEAQVVDQNAVANELQTILSTDNLRERFAALYKAYIDTDNKPRTFKPLLNCSDPNGSVTECVKINMGLTVELQPAELPRCTKEKSLACYRTVKEQIDGVKTEADCRRKGGSNCKKEALVPTKVYLATGEAALPGLLVRQPASATLLICRTAVKDTCSAKTIVPKKLVDVPQYGQLRLLPLVNKVFQNNALTLSVSPLGRIETFSYANNKAVAQVVSSMLKSGTDQYVAFRKERDAAEEKVSTQATQDIKKQVDYLQAQIDLKAKQATLNPATVSDEARNRQAEIADATGDANYYKAKQSALVSASCYQLAETNQPLPEYCF
jgi:predicted RecB family endonuclease